MLATLLSRMPRHQIPSLAQGEHLWVDKYSPRSFLELLGDEEINREVVRWLKQWDRCVFGDTKGHPHGPGGARGRARAKTGKQALDSRPEERILLICGAPGTGPVTCLLERWSPTSASLDPALRDSTAAEHTGAPYW